MANGLERIADPCTIVILGAGGDLTRRKLLPALCNLRSHGLLPKDFALIGVARRDLDDQGFRAQLTREVPELAAAPAKTDSWADFLSHVYFNNGDFADARTF